MFFFFFHKKANTSRNRRVTVTIIPTAKPTTKLTFIFFPFTRSGIGICGTSLISSPGKFELSNAQALTLLFWFRAPVAAENPKVTHSGNTWLRSTM
ncbi:hypothetical protein HanRHA438_Chr09g0376201 [Helianthus annuus]|nr:hypothetical protein HanRHA438_Chr09g0376201 [Helianthus annuus]